MDEGRMNVKLLTPKLDVVFDIDDFCDHGFDGKGSRWELIEELKSLFPALKITLFTIPALSTRGFLEDAVKHDWVELAVHGWLHEPNWECLLWDAGITNSRLDEAERWAVFQRAFKAPGWQISEVVLRVLAARGYWTASLSGTKSLIRQLGLKAYFADTHPWAIHGHIQDIDHPDPSFRNGLRQLMYERGLPFGHETRFHLVSEVVDRVY